MASSARHIGAVLPRGWPKRVKSGVVHAISLARVTMTTSWGFCAMHRSARVRLNAENERLRHEVGLLLEEIRIKDARMMRIPAHQRPHYPPIDRLAVLELRAARGWSLYQTAERLLVSTATVSSWMRRLDDDGPRAVVETSEPVNKFPLFVSYIVRRLKVLCPSLGYDKIAQLLCRAGLHLGTTTVRRMLRQTAPPRKPQRAPRAKRRLVTGRYPGQVWHADLTAVPTSLGLWTSAAPFALPRRWPFCWWIAVVADQYSRRIMGVAVYAKLPTSLCIRDLLARIVRDSKAPPGYLVSDRGSQFSSHEFRRWCRCLGIRQRFGALGQFGSIAIAERLILTIKNECLRRVLVPFSKASVRRELSLYAAWYNRERPHERFATRTPDEVYERLGSPSLQPRFEPRADWPKRSPCAAPRSRIEGSRGARLDLQVDYLAGRRHLPIVTLKRVA